MFLHVAKPLNKYFVVFLIIVTMLIDDNLWLRTKHCKQFKDLTVTDGRLSR